MATTAVVSSVLVPSLRTIRNKSSSLTSSTAGAQSTLFSRCSATRCLISCRCFARPDELDRAGDLRFREHTEVLVDHFDHGVLWDSFGIVADVIVSLALYHNYTHGLTLACSHSQIISLVPTFTNFSPPTSSINSSRERSRTISSLGSISTLSTRTVIPKATRSWTILTDGMFLCILFV